MDCCAAVSCFEAGFVECGKSRGDDKWQVMSILKPIVLTAKAMGRVSGNELVVESSAKRPGTYLFGGNRA